MTRTTAVPRAIPTVSAVLAPIHDRWTQEVKWFVSPATDVQAGFWSRWGAARFLGDQFQGRFRLEGSFVTELEPLLGPEAAARLSVAREKVERSSAELMAIGRRRGVAEPTVELARRFIQDLGRWWVELELATAHLRSGDLPPVAGSLLGRLQVADELTR
jgi:hypothetical protein